MAKLTENQIDLINNHVSADEAVLKRKYEAKRKAYDETSVPYSELEALVKEGWEETAHLKRRVKMQRNKAHDIAFEDEIWCMFYELGFRNLNTDRNLAIQWGPNEGDHQQIDILAVGDDAIFVVECKSSSASSKLASFKNALDHIEHIRQGLTDSLHQLYGKDKKVKYIFATRNYRFAEDSEDLRRMKDKKIFHLNENAYKYIKGLIKSYKGCVQYQFYGLMFKNELINSEKIRIPALRGTMGKHTYYMMSIEPATLLKLGFVLHRTKVNDSMAPTYQRMLVPSRLKGIGKFIDEGGYFPNSIIVNFDTANTKMKIQFEPAGKGTGDSDSRFGTLIIPNTYGIAYIIDGQHRVYGYADSKYKDTNTIPVVAFDNMESREQLQIFMDINENQKAVSPSLRLDLKEDIDWESPRLDSRMGALRSSIIKTLSQDSNSVLYNKIYVGEDSASLTFRPFDEALKKSTLLPKCTQKEFKEDMDVCLYECYSTQNDTAMLNARKRIVAFIRDCYQYMKDCLTEDIYQDYIETNRGTFGLIATAGTVHKYLVHKGILSIKSTNQERRTALQPYLKMIANYLSNLSSEDRTALEVRGQQAETTWLRKFQLAIHTSCKEFEPDGFLAWLETQDKNLQEDGHKLGKQIGYILTNRVMEKIKELYGDKWESSISDVRANCKKRIIEKEQNDDSFDAENANWEDFIDLTDVKTIINKNWTQKLEDDSQFVTFEKEFSIKINHTEPFKTKKEKLRWLDEYNSYRDAWEKPKGKMLTRQQVDIMRIILQSLQPD